MFSTPSNCWIDKRRGDPRLVLLLLVGLFLLPRPPSLAAQDPLETLLEVPVPLTVLAGAHRSRIVLTARVTESMELHSLESSPLFEAIGDLLTPDVTARLRAATQGATQDTSQAAETQNRWLGVEEFATHGISLRFDTAELEAELVIPVENLRAQTLAVFERRQLPPYTVADNAPVALGVPLWAQHRATHFQGGEAIQALTFRAAPALHVLEWVVESDLRLEWSNDTTGATDTAPDLTAENTRLVRIWDDIDTRLQVGQFTQLTRGLQAPMQLLGVSFDNLQADTGRTIIPALFARPFIIDQAGTIDVYLNERRTRSFQVQPGQYELTDFPVTAGINTVRVEYTRDTGEVEHHELIVPHAGGLVKAGALSYAAALGAEEDDPSLPAGSGFVRYGLRNDLTTGLLLDTSTRGTQAGLELISATPWGEPLVSVYGSLDDDLDPGWATQAGYRLSIPGRPQVPVVSTSIEYRDPGFIRAGAQADATRQSWQISTSISQPLPAQIGLVAGHVHRMYHDPIADSSYLYGTVSRALGPRFNLRITGSVDILNTAENWGVSITVSTQAARRSLGGSATLDAKNATLDLAGSAARPGATTYSAGARIRGIELKNGTVGGFSGSARAAGSRFDLTGSGSLNLTAADSVPDQEFQSGTYSVQLGSGVYIAEGVVGLGAPIRSAFVLVRPDSELPTRTIDVRTGGRNSVRKSGRLGAAVLGPLARGSREQVLVEIPGIPADYALGTTEYIVIPGYRSGTAITIVSSRRLYVRGQLLDAAGDPVPYRGLVVTPRFEVPRDLDGTSEGLLDDETIGGPAFTDETGVFEIYGLIPGQYTVTLRDGSGRETTLTVPDEPGPLVTVDPIILPGGSQ